MDKILYKNELLGIRINKIKSGTTLITDGSGALELLTQKKKKGHIVTPHAHKKVRRTTVGLQECIVVLEGRIRIDLYASEKNVVKRVTIKKGEAFITLSGGHSVHFLEDSEILEAKNGPFVKDRIEI